MTSRVLILRGRLVQLLNAAPHDGPASNYVALWGVEFQLTATDGTVPTSDYCGPGCVSKGDDGRTYLVLGTGQETNLAEYIVADSATDESWAAFLEFRAGFTAGVAGKRKRRNADPNGPWMEGYAEGRRQASGAAA
jgi:hypothetical protein